MTARQPRLLIFVTEDWYFCSHRIGLAIAAREAGYEVSVVTRVRKHGEQIRAAGLALVPLELSRRGVNPLTEIRLVFQLFKVYRNIRPDIVHHVALKPVLYGSLAARLASVKRVVNALAGLGFLFSSDSKKARIAQPIVRLAFRMLLNRPTSRVILQNPDDVELMCNGGVLSRDRVVLIRGSGVDLNEFAMTSQPPGQPVVLLASRLLWDKGIGEFVAAARMIREHSPQCRFILVGEGDSENPSAISEKQLQEWQQEGAIEWWGRREDMPTVLSQANVVCLPSAYGEGVPKVLIEAAACGRAIVTTDTPGCREIVQDGNNGLLVPVRDVAALAAAIKRLIDDPALRLEMGRRGRELVENEFSIEKVVVETLALYASMIK